jgi:1,4-alpha-glucan branching enzyme
VLKRSATKITFILPDAVGPVSVVGDFNDWDPHLHPLRRRSNATRSVALDLAPGTYAFRYLSDGGVFFDEPDADAVEANGLGDTHSLLLVGGR